MSRELLFSLNKKDFELEFYRGSGKGGQNRNKVETGVKIYHRASGAVAQSCEERSQHQNKCIAFDRLVKTDKFQTWLKIKASREMEHKIDIEKEVDNWMKDEFLKIETYEVE